MPSREHALPYWGGDEGIDIAASSDDVLISARRMQRTWDEKKLLLVLYTGAA